MEEHKTPVDQLKDIAGQADILQNLLDVGYGIYDDMKRGYVCDAAFFLSQQLAADLHDFIAEMEKAMTEIEKESETA